MSDLKEIDLVNRDPHNMNNYLQVEYDDVFAEPSGTHSADCVWRNSYKCFTCSKNICYKILTFLCGIFIAIFWGCAFAKISFTVIWCWSPALRALHIVLYPIKKILQIFLSSNSTSFIFVNFTLISSILIAFVGPCMEVHALIFSRIHVTQSQGPPPKPIDMIDGDQPPHFRK